MSQPPQEPNPLYQFLRDLANCMSRILHANGFGRVGIAIEVVGNRRGKKKFALILEGQPSYRYVFDIQHFYDLIDNWKSKEDS